MKSRSWKAGTQRSSRRSGKPISSRMSRERFARSASLTNERRIGFGPDRVGKRLRGMNYAHHYEKLIARARARFLKGYSERHHVVPKCMGGGNESWNLVELTAEEHYVAHQLLCRMHPTNSLLIYGAVSMAKRCSGNKAYGWLPEHRL